MTFQTGHSYSGFTLQQHAYLEEISSDVYLFVHDVLGCPLFAIKNGDSNKTFSVVFNTIPEDSTGVAHILEHSVLMGSRKYPVKDVFGEIHKGGLMTFLNAMTGSDLTYYPFATRNLKEYFNLMDVYCDVVFHPLLDRSTFEQEGWHYHQESEDGPLEYQGVVYNEMKGAFSDPIRSIFQHIFSGLMPGSTYAHESGGDPQHIPDLSYEQFCAFHADHYHPSNCMLYVYGDAPLADELNYLQDNFLAAYKTPGHRATIVAGLEPSGPVFITDTYAVDAQETKEKTFLAVGTQVSTVIDREENAAFQIIANILFNSDASPLKNAIVSSGLGKDFGGFYISSSSYKTCMVTYLVGSEADRRDAFLELYTASLSEMVAGGLDRELVLSELNKYEFTLREEGSKSQRGLDLIGKATVAMKYGTDPFAGLTSDELIASLRHKALNENYFEELIRKYLLDNQSTVTVTLVPDPDKLAANQRIEAQRLADYAATLSVEERRALVARTLELQQEQLKPNSVETLSLLPQLSLTDLNGSAHFHQVSPREMFGHEVLVSELETNHISYIDIGFDLRAIPPRLLPWLDLFGTILTEIGTTRLGYIDFAKEIATCTGSFSHSLNSYAKRQEADNTRPLLWLHLKCLPDYLDQALELVAEVVSSPSFADRQRIREIVGREFAWAEHAAQSEGYNLVSARIFAHLSLAGRYNELLSGITAYQALKSLAVEYDRQEEDFLAALAEIAGLLFNRNNLILSLTADQRQVERFAAKGDCLVAALATEPVKTFDLGPLAIADHEAFISSAEIVFALQGGNLFGDGLGYNGQFEVLKTYLSRDYLWNTVRQMGGAYGCFVQFSQISGNIAFVSYRDPQVRKTFDAYAAVPGVVAALDIPPRTMEQLIIGTYGNFDPHQSPASRGASARNEYLSGITAGDKQQRLSEIIATTTANLQSFAPAFAKMIENSHRAAVGNRTKIEKDRDLFDQLTEL